MGTITSSLFRYLKRRFDGTGVLNVGIFRWIRNRMFNVIKKDYIMLEGYKLKLDKNDSLRLSINPNYEEMTGSVIRDIVKPGDLVIDVGANIGYWTLVFSKLVGSQGTVFAFEPEESNYYILTDNILNNGIKNVFGFRVGLSNDYKVGKLYLCKTNSGDHRTVDDGNREVQTVQYKRLDDIAHPIYLYKQINLIKIDIQGAEMMFLEGAQEFFKRNKNIKIITEVWDYGLKRAGSSAEEYLTALQDLGFSFRLIDESKNHNPLLPISIEQILTEGYIKDKKYCNLLCER